MRFRSSLFFVAVLFYSSFGHAYIPPYWMILSRTAQNHGKGAYTINEDVAFPNPAAPTGMNGMLMTHEHWVILDDLHMRLDVRGVGDLQNQIHLTYVYQNGERYYLSETGVRRASRAPATWFEPFFTFRSSRAFQSFAVARGVTPPDSARSRPQRFSIKKPAPPTAEAFLRLARVDGTVSYAIGEPSPVGSSNLLPGLWIKQDQFVVKKVRYPSGVEILAQKYRQYKSLWYPQILSVKWADGKAQITVTSVTPLANEKIAKKRVNPRELSMSRAHDNEPGSPLLLPTNSAVREFYTQMR